MNRVCEILGIEYPIIGGPMAYTTTPPLVAAVSNGGGLGVLGLGFTPIDFMIESIHETRKLTDKPFATNILMFEGWESYGKAIAEMENPPYIYLTIESVNYDIKPIADMVELWHSKGIKVILKGIDIRSIRAGVNINADIIIAKGWEGGGVTTPLGTTIIVPRAYDVIREMGADIPIVAGGGIADGRTAAATRIMGAEGYELGTIFMLAEEFPQHPNVQKKLLEADADDVLMTGVLNTIGLQFKQLDNPLTQKVIQIEHDYAHKEAFEKSAELTKGASRKAMIDGDTENGTILCGQNIGLIKEIKPAAQIIREIMEESEAILQEKMTIW